MALAERMASSERGSRSGNRTTATADRRPTSAELRPVRVPLGAGEESVRPATLSACRIAGHLATRSTEALSSPAGPGDHVMEAGLLMRPIRGIIAAAVAVLATLPLAGDVRATRS